MQVRAREAFYKRYSAGKEWKMTDGKDIVVNRAKLGRQGCVDVIAAAYRFKFAEVGQAPRPLPPASSKPGTSDRRRWSINQTSIR